MPVNLLNALFSFFKNSPLSLISFSLYSFSMLFGTQLLNLFRKVTCFTTFIFIYLEFYKNFYTGKLVPLTGNFLLNRSDLLKFIPNFGGKLWLNGFLSGIYLSLYIGVFLFFLSFTTSRDAKNKK